MQTVINNPISSLNSVGSDLNDTWLTVKKKKTWTKPEVQRVDEPLTSEAVLDRFDSDSSVNLVRPNPREFYRGYNGRINPHHSGPQYFYVNDVRDSILFSQRIISDFNKGKNCDYPLDTLADAMFIKYNKDNDRFNDGVLDIVDNGDGTFTSLDNRRVFLAYKFADYDRYYGIWIRVHSQNEELNKGLQKRFLGARTWGEAAEIRVNNPKVRGYKKLPTIMDEGQPKKSQSIDLSLDGCSLSALHPEDLKRLRTKKSNGIFRI